MKAGFEWRTIWKTTSLGFGRAEFANSVTCQLWPNHLDGLHDALVPTLTGPWGHHGLADLVWAPQAWCRLRVRSATCAPFLAPVKGAATTYTCSSHGRSPRARAGHTAGGYLTSSLLSLPLTSAGHSKSRGPNPRGRGVTCSPLIV